MAFQNYVYTLVSDDAGCALGVYPNFKKAYERLEEHANGKAIFDCSPDKDYNLKFEIIEVDRYVRVRKYSIYRSLLTIFPHDELVSVSMADQLEAEFKRKTTNAKYKLMAEVM